MLWPLPLACQGWRVRRQTAGRFACLTVDVPKYGAAGKHPKPAAAQKDMWRPVRLSQCSPAERRRFMRMRSLMPCPLFSDFFLRQVLEVI